MAINSVTSTVAAATPAVVPQTQTDEAQRARQAQNQQAQATQQPPAPQPVVNALGQTTGTVINTTA